VPVVPPSAAKNMPEKSASSEGELAHAASLPASDASQEEVHGSAAYSA